MTLSQLIGMIYLTDILDNTGTALSNEINDHPHRALLKKVFSVLRL